jgi:hypothetical protein
VPPYVEYDDTRGMWFVGQEDNHALPARAAFNVYVAPALQPGQSVSWFVQWNFDNFLRDSVCTDNPLLNGKARAVVIVTHDVKPVTLGRRQRLTRLEWGRALPRSAGTGWPCAWCPSPGLCARR